MNNIEVSIYCLAYNCVDFIERSISGLVSQKTNFNYKVIIHDDASNDGTAEIIRRKAEQYSDKICAILQQENQYSKGVNIWKTYIEPNIEGDYIAICEGDDCWIDDNKLQLQYDFMKSHPECSLCTHNTIDYDSKHGKRRLFNQWKMLHELTPQEVFLDRGVHTSSYFLKRDCRNWPGKGYWFGDYIMLTWAFYRGKVYSLPQVMSLYNRYNANGIMQQIDKMGIKEANNRQRMQKEYLHEYNQLTQFKYDDMIQKTCRYVDFYCSKREFDYIIMHSKSKKECIRAAKKVTSQEYYKEYLQTRHGLGLIMARFNCEGYFCYPLWKLIKKLYPIVFKNWE